MKKFWIFATAAGLGFCASAQTFLSLSDQMLLAEMQQQGARGLSAADAPAKATVSMFYRVADNDAVARLQALGVNVRQQEGKIIICDVPLDAVDRTLAATGVEHAQLSKKRRLLNNLAREATGVDKVRSGEGLSQPYDGTGVIAGIFDAGIDPNHIAFKDADGNLRVSRAYDFYTYDTTCDTYVGDEVTSFPTTSSETHGTHTMGTMASSYVPLSSGVDFSGIATGAEIVAAEGLGYDDNFIGAVRNIANYAKSQDKPCVINLSWGSNDDGPHDGSDDFVQALDAIAGEEGVHLFISSGNEGQEPIGIYKEFTAADNIMRTFIEPTASNAEYGGPGTLSQGKGAVSVWSDSAEPVDAYLDIYDLESPDAPIYTLEIPEGKNKFLASGYKSPSGVASSDIDRNVTEFVNVYSQSYMGGRRGISPLNGCYRVELAFDITASSRANFRRYSVSLRVEGKPGQKVHAYGATTQVSSSNMFYIGFGSKDMDGFMQSTGDGTLNSMACGDNMIVVGAYSTRQGGEDTVSGQPIYEPEEMHAPVSFSSWGHMLDGRLKPDVLAPGYVIISSMNTVYARGHYSSLSYYGTPVKDIYEEPATGKPYYWTIMAGTSMAAPHMSGVAALWLQAKPDMTTDEILDVIRHTSYKPENATDNWGPNGLVNAYDGLKYILGDFNDIKDVAAAESAIMLNPEGNGMYEVSSPAESGLTVALYNMQGARVADFATAGSELTVTTAGLPAGVYVLRAATSTSAISHKIIVK